MSFTFAIGDIHGCREELERLLDRIRMARPDGGTVVFLGDYVDRGPDSKGVIDIIMAGPKSDKWKWVALKGNHEDMMVSCIRRDNPLAWWVGNGGSMTLSSYESLEVMGKHLAWAEALPMIHHDRYRIFVHAGVDETVPFDCQSEHDLLWKRFPPHWSGTYWDKHLVHGHTPESNNPLTIGNRTNIDGGCVFGGQLCCAVFDDDVPGEPIEFISVGKGKDKAA
jgi:serine/threonine protein phosphatase 1